MGIVADGGKRRFHLVRNIGDEVRFQGLNASQLCDHGIEIMNHQIQIIFLFLAVERLDPDCKIPVSDLLCRGRNPLQRCVVGGLHPVTDQPCQE